MKRQCLPKMQLRKHKSWPNNTAIMKGLEIKTAHQATAKVVVISSLVTHRSSIPTLLHTHMHQYR